MLQRNDDERELDARMMRRAIELAQRAVGLTSPNPLVGAVITDAQGIAGEGWHRGIGQPHAEADAIRDAGARCRGSTAYVTLEPCHHTGRTPPCTAALIDAGVTRVVYAVTDPNPIAHGGAQALHAAGLTVLGGVEEHAARELARTFLHHVETRRPWVIAKSATSLDGRVATAAGQSRWITGPEARHAGHRLRQAMDAILVGAGTVLADDPSLTVRLPEHECRAADIRHPRPVLLDSHGRIPATVRLLDGSLETRPLHLIGEHVDAETRARLADTAAELLVLPGSPDTGRIPIASLLAVLGERVVQGLLVEGGPIVHGAFRDAGAIDEVWACLAPSLIGGSMAPSSYAGCGAAALDEAVTLERVRIETLGSDLLVRGFVRRAGTTALTSRFASVAIDSPSSTRSTTEEAA